MEARSLLMLVFLQLLPMTLSAQREGLLSKIEDPYQYFEDNRRRWIGKTIYFLRRERRNGENPYFDWYYNPFDMEHSKPKPEEIKFQTGTIEEVWLGQIHMVKPEKDYWRLGFFWKVRLHHSGQAIYFWDDGECGVSNFGFVEDYEQARRHIGETLWNKSRDVLYLMNDQGVVSLQNLQRVQLIDVQWGEFGNFPLKFVLQTEDGKKGYYLERNYNRFIKEWYTFDPKEKFSEWRRFDWDLIERRVLRSGMTPDMVMISWGKPSKVESRYDKKGRSYEIWTYKGVRKTTYYVRFQENKLQRVWWEDKEKNNPRQ